MSGSVEPIDTNKRKKWRETGPAANRNKEDPSLDRTSMIYGRFVIHTHGFAGGAFL
jgi:hypothetical protein